MSYSLARLARSFRRWHRGLALPLLAAVSAGDELLQSLLAWRVGSLFDVAFNVISASGGYGLVRYHESKRAGRADAP